MTSPGRHDVPPLRVRQPSVRLVDCLRTAAGLTAAVRPAPEGSSDDPPVLPLRRLSIRLVDCVKTPAPNGRTAPLAAEESHASVEVKSEEEDKQWEADAYRGELSRQPAWCRADAGAEDGLFKEEAGSSAYDDKDHNCEETDELRSSLAGPDGTLSMIRNDGGYSDGVMCLRRTLKTERTDATSQDGRSDDVAAAERHGATDEEALEPGDGDENKAEQKYHCSATRGTPSQPESEQTDQETYSRNKSSLAFRTKRHLRVRVRAENGKNDEGQEISEEAPRKRRHACKQCNKRFYMLHTLRKHLLTHTGEKLHNCEVCKKRCRSEATLKEHQLTHAGKKLFQCEQCGKTCARRGDLKIHMLSHSEERPYSCSYCAKSFKQRAKLKQHERVHTGEKPYQCKLCSKQFRLQTLLAEHRYTHSGERPFKCNLCPKAFSSRNNLKKHQMIHTGEKPYCCSHCGKRCRLLQHLVIHERSHTGEKPHKCDKCGKGYSHHAGLKTHQSTHEEKPLCCSLCGLDIADLAEVTSHECHEMVEKPHSCSQCGKRFSQAVTLKKHQLIHTGEKAYCCTDCGKQFNHKGNLTKHMRIHTGEKPFKCEHCKRGFRLLQHLKNHRLTHSKTD